MVLVTHGPTTCCDGTEIAREGAGGGASEAARYARSLIAMSLNPLVSMDPQGKITEVNKATEEATGVPRDRLIGTDFADCFAEPEKAQAAFQRVLEEGLLSDYPLALRHVSGAFTEVEYNATVYRDESGELQAVFAAARDATEAQEARLQVARLAAIASSSLCAMFSRDLDGVITSWNAAAEALYGYAAQEAIGRNGAILVPPGREGETQEIIKRMLRGDRGFGFETQRLCKDGSQLDVAFTLSPIRDAAGDITGLSIADHDISERVRAERELRESEEKFSAAFHASPDLMIITTLSDDTLLEVNEGFTHLLGYSRDETIGTSILELAIWADPAERATLVASLKEAGQAGETETTLRRKDGDLITGIESARAFEFQGETCVLSVFHDISERMRAERALLDSEARYRGYLDHAPYGVFITDENGRYLEVNRAAAELTGYSAEELTHLGIVDLLPAESLDSGPRQFSGLLKTGASSGSVDLARKDGSSFHVRLDAVRLSATRYLGFIVDISEQKHAEEEIIAGAARLKVALTATVAALGATIELRDPYTAGHQRRVAELVVAIAAELGWDEARVEMLETAALLHDVGKIVVPAEILTKPGRLSGVEMQLIRQHAAASAALIADIEFGGPVAAIVIQHHERLDGTGYPAGLVAEQLLPEASALAVADVVEAMSSHRPYRAALGVEAALAEVRAHVGVKYDADVVAACARLIEEQGFEFTP